LQEPICCVNKEVNFLWNLYVLFCEFKNIFMINKGRVKNCQKPKETREIRQPPAWYPADGAETGKLVKSK
jgi:hypothetical protein